MGFFIVYTSPMFKFKVAKRLIESSDLKRAAIADKCRIHTQTLTNYINGKGQPSPAVVTLLAQALKIPESELWKHEVTKKAS